MNKYSLFKIPSDILRETADQHRKLRKAMKITQMELAERSGVSLGSIKRFERTGQISFESLLKLANILGSLSEFEGLFQPKEKNQNIESLFSDKMQG